MCCFSGPIERVIETRIFARGLPSGEQLLVYQMTAELASDVAMVLPLPTPPHSDEAAVQFVDLSGTPQFFEDLEAAFPYGSGVELKEMSVATSAGNARPRLAVHVVGAFEASFVPSQKDFVRLEPRFRLKKSVLSSLHQYGDYGFAVFKLQANPQHWVTSLFRKRPPQSFHPMAFRFPRRCSEELFIPTVHVHDGRVHETAFFNHKLFCQHSLRLDSIANADSWARSSWPVGKVLDGKDPSGMTDPGAFAYFRRLFGHLPNRDIVLSEAETKAQIERHAVELKADIEQQTTRLKADMERGGWFSICARRIPVGFWPPQRRQSAGLGQAEDEAEGPTLTVLEVEEALHAVLKGLFTEKQDAWRLGPVDMSVRRPLNGPHTHEIRLYDSGPECYRAIEAVIIGFREPPSAECCQEIAAELRRWGDVLDQKFQIIGPSV